MNIILGLTGSVATTLAPKIAAAMKGVAQCRSLRVVMTEKATHFFPAVKLQGEVFTEQHEWRWEGDDNRDESELSDYVHGNVWSKGKPVLHIELAKNASCLVIAPATMNTIAKMAHGITDNLLTSVYAAWDTNRPVIIAPAMNTRMLNSVQNQCNIESLEDRGVIVVPSVTKMLACGDYGDGAMADINDIAAAVNKALTWNFPIYETDYAGIPIGSHLGAFGAIRKHDRHCGVDLYCQKGTRVFAVEAGTVISVEDFTGPDAGCPWWLPTKAVKVEGATGVVCYGEITPCLSVRNIRVGGHVSRGDIIGTVIPVLPENKHRPDIPGHSCSMLHIQVYNHGTSHKDHDWSKDGAAPDNLIDPTPYLLAAPGVSRTLEMI